jgi:hypothetical protein
MVKHYLLALLLAINFRPAFSATFYVAPAGNDAHSGTIQQPFLTIQRAQAAVAAGDTVYIRGGTYLMQNSQIAGYASPYAYVTLLNKSGSATAGRINYWAYPGEQPVFNYANLDPNLTSPNAPFAAPYRLSAFEVTGSYIYLRGLEVVGVRVPRVASNVNTLSICFSQSGAGGNNIYEQLSMHDGQAIGFYLTRGPNNLILNCDAYRNNDNVNTTNSTGTANGGNVDGFGCHPNNANYTGNVFRGCRAWQNSDDGYDCISAFAATVFENCWAFYNGYTQNFVSRGDGNGFKAGGYGSTAYASLPAVIPSNTVRFCVSVRNRSNGFYSNHHLEGSTWLNNTAYQNAINFDMLNRKAKTTADYLTDVPGYHHTLRNNISLLARSTNTATRDLADCDVTACTIDHNTFLNPNVTVDASDFVSLDTTLLRTPRQADGSLPSNNLLRLAPGSDLVDAGLDVGFPYSGRAPDLGAFETGLGSPALDTTPPVLRVAGLTTQLVNGTRTLEAADIDYGSYDEGGSIVLMSINPRTFTCANIGPNLVTFTATDEAGNSTSETVTVVIVDKEAPVVRVAGLTAQLQNGVRMLEAADIDYGSYDNCGSIVSMSISPRTFTCANLGPNLVTFTATDNAGNSTSETVTVVITADATCPATPTIVAGSERLLLQAYPNPTRDQTTLSFEAQQAGPAQVLVYNAQGQLVATLYEGVVAAQQQYRFPLDSQALPTGLYSCQLRTAAGIQTTRLLVVK